MQDYKNTVITGISWSVVSQVGRQGITFIIGVILARLLSPEEFGLIAMVTILTGFASIFAELGFGSAIIQRKDVHEGHLSSVFWVNIFFGALLTLIFIQTSNWIADFYNEPTLQPITVALAFNFLISSTAIVQRSLFTKSVDFKSLTIVRLSTTIVSGGIAIYMAFAGFGVWSLVARSIIDSFFQALVLWLLSGWKPKPLFSWNRLKELLHFSLNLLGNKSMIYAVRNTDDFLIGKFIGSSSLGIYSKAYSVMVFPLQNVSQVISRVMFPSFSTIQDDKERIKRIFLKMTKTIALITFPMMAGLWVISDLFVVQVFGEQWNAMIPILRIFCFLGMSQSINTLVGNLFLSQGRTDIMFRLGLVVKTFVVGAIILGLQWGVLGVVISYTAASIITFIPEMYYAGKLVNLKVTEVFKSLIPILVISSIMAGIVFSSRFYLDAYDIAASIKLLILILIGFISYPLLLILTNNETFKGLKLLISNRINNT